MLTRTGAAQANFVYFFTFSLHTSPRPCAVNQILQPTASSRGVGGEGQRDKPFAVCGHSLPMKPDSHQQWSLQVHSQKKGSTRTRGKLPQQPRETYKEGCRCKAGCCSAPGALAGQRLRHLMHSAASLMSGH